MPKIEFSGRMCVEHSVLERNMAHARGLGLQHVPKPARGSIHFHGIPLAVVGGGPSVKEHLDELRTWRGDIWGINGASAWLRTCGVESTLFSLDPLPVLAERCAGAKEAILCTRCAPELFKVLEGAHIRIFDCAQDVAEGGIVAGCASVLGVPDIATDMGYRELTFFGCEGSFTETTHLYMDDPQDFRFVVKCGEVEYMTLPELYVLTKELAALLRVFRTHFTERSGGLLRAMIANPEHDIVKVSRGLMAGLKKAA